MFPLGSCRRPLFPSSRPLMLQNKTHSVCERRENQKASQLHTWLNSSGSWLQSTRVPAPLHKLGVPCGGLEHSCKVTQRKEWLLVDGCLVNFSFQSLPIPSAPALSRLLLASLDTHLVATSWKNLEITSASALLRFDRRNTTAASRFPASISTLIWLARSGQKSERVMV